MANKQHFQWAVLAVALLLALCLPLAASAQSKPKRDVTKDQVTTPRKQKRAPRKVAKTDNTPAKTTTQATPAKPTRRTTSRSKCSTRTSTPQQEVRPETYLRVNQLTQLTRHYSRKGAEETFEVNTNDKDWEVRELPEWCTTSRMGQRFTLTCQPNPYYEPRSSWFIVRSDDRTRTVLIDITQDARAASGSIGECYIWHNTVSYIQNGTGAPTVSKNTLSVKVTGKVDEPRNKKWYVTLCFRYPNKAWVKANKGYKLCRQYQSTHDGELIGVSYFYPNQDGTFDTTIWIPNEAFDIPYGRKFELECVLGLQCEGCNVYSGSVLPYLTIKARNKKGKVKTK